jgi:hypothetical protein
MLSASCTALRPRDDERVKIANEASTLAQELRQPDADPFAAMARNVETVAAAFTAIDAIQEKDRQNTFYAGLADLTREELLVYVTESLGVHIEATAAARDEIRKAGADIQAELARHEQISRIVAAPTDAGLESVLNAVDARIEWFMDLQMNVSKALTAINQIDPSISTTKQVKEAQRLSKNVNANLAAVSDFIDKINSDPKVAAAGQLLLRSGQQLAQAEQQRLLEMRDYLKAVEFQAGWLAERNVVYYRSLFIPALSRLATHDEFVVQLLKIETSLKTSAKIESSRVLDEHEEILGDILGWIGDPDTTEDPETTRQIQAALKAAIDERQDRWCDGCTLQDFVTASLKVQLDDPASTQGMEAIRDLVSPIGILLFVEEPKYRQAALDLAKEGHLRSIRLSQINAQERLDLAHQVSQALQIYYQGGVTPAEAAQAILMASQVLSLGFIGGQI